MKYVYAYVLLIIAHELGHILFAKVFGVKVEQLSIFFGSPLYRRTFFTNNRLGKYSFEVDAFTFKIGWMPFGGYVLLKGMKHDEGLGSFITIPKWQRAIIILGGIIVNVAFGLAFACLAETRFEYNVGMISLLMAAFNLFPGRADGKQLLKLI